MKVIDADAFKKKFYSDGNPECDYLLDRILRVVDMMPSPWVPITEGPPKSAGVYMVSRWFTDGEDSAILTDACYYDGNGTWYNDNRINWGRDLVTDTIVAWMPEIDPYTAEDLSQEEK